MLNKSNNEIELCSKNFETKNKWSKNGSDNSKKLSRSTNKSKLNSILNRTLSDSILNKKSTSLSHTFQSHKVCFIKFFKIFSRLKQKKLFR